MTDRHNALVTGAASGIGRRLVGGLAEAGDHVVAADIDTEGLAESADELGWSERGVETATLDVRRHEDWQRVVDRIVERHGRIDLLVHSAAVADGGPIVEMEPEHIERQIDVNMKGTILGTRVVGAAMASRGAGHIVNFGSLSSLAPVPGIGVYASTKFGVRGFSLAAAQELRPEGVAVTVVMPDTVDTPLLEKVSGSNLLEIAFAGTMLSVEDVEQVFFDRILPNRPLEATIPRTQGALSRLASLAPGLLHWLEPILERIGGAHLDAYRRDESS